MSDAMRELQAKCGVAADGQFGPNTAKAIAKFYQLSPEAASHFLGQCHHESGGFKRKPEENLNYSAKGLRSTFGRYFKTDEQAEEYARQNSEDESFQSAVGGRSRLCLRVDFQSLSRRGRFAFHYRTICHVS